MNDYDPSELIAVCDSIIEDGEISGDELYALAEWLNNHREACSHWPGELLVKPLQDLWADGKATQTEMRQMGRLLVRIRKEWTKRHAEQLLEQASKYAEQAAASFDFSHPQLPLVPLVTRIKSHTDKSVIYDVDLNGPACTCPDWTSLRSNLPPGHLTRCCKHVFSAYEQIAPDCGWPGWLGALFDSGWPPHPQQKWFVLPIDGAWVLASMAPKGWANVFAPTGGKPDARFGVEYERFGYNVAEDRWAYGIEPRGSDRIARAVLAASH